MEWVRKLNIHAGGELIATVCMGFAAEQTGIETPHRIMDASPVICVFAVNSWKELI